MTHAASRRAPAAIDSSAALDTACARIAPTFPLDRFIAVNPYWGLVADRIELSARRLGHWSGARLLMPRAWYRDRWQAGQLTPQHLQTALEQSQTAGSVEQLVHHLETDSTVGRRLTLMTHVLDERREVGRQMPWAGFVIHSMSQLCASHFDDGQAAWTSNRELGLYAAWRSHALSDRSPSLMMGCSDLRPLVRELPESHREAIDEALHELGVSAEVFAEYLTALLLDINGWAAFCAYRRWQARLAGADDDAIEQLLAVRIAWELLLFRSGDQEARDARARRWSAQVREWPREEPSIGEDERLDWVLQLATEIAFQQQLVEGLRGTTCDAAVAAPTAQVVFCIDVRSEPFRRALESASPTVQTLGFAGFFGLPIEYSPLGTELHRPQLPGLLAPRLRAGDVASSHEAALSWGQSRRARLGASQAQVGFKQASSSAFAFVEALGLGYAAKLAKDSLGLGSRLPLDAAGLTASALRGLRPRLVSTTEGTAVKIAERVELAANILKATTLLRGFARLVVFVGHGSESANNPHASGLDCGACSGQSGALNARVLAAVLNDREVRSGLAERGIVIPETTYFLGGGHNTTTDELVLFDDDEAPESHRGDIAVLARGLLDAGARTRAERAPGLGLRGNDAELLRAVRRRARDWAEVRPEWGLADNAAFLVAPRERSRNLNLAGRVFLHDYHFADDDGFRILELIMTAPMIVTNWINLQYYASTVDNERYGSGNKVLHNVVGGHLGVFEGNGGDLRIGLPMQSVHDGERFRHTPLRLSVFIDAPQAAIDSVIAKHALVRQLVDNGWLHLFQLDGALVSQRRAGAWHAV